MPAARDLRLLVGAVGLSSLGDRVALVPLALLVEQRGGTGLAVAALFVAMWSPAALLAGPAGLLADRWSPRRLLILSSLAAAGLSAGLAFTGALAAVLALVALMGCLNAVATPAEFALLPLVAGKRGIARANGRVEFARYAGFILGPAVGGLLAAAGGTTGALLANAATFLVLAAVSAAIRVEWRAAHPRGARAHARRHRVPRPRRGVRAGDRDRLSLAAADDRDARGRAVLRRRRPAHGRRGLRDPDGDVGRRDGDRRVRGRPAVRRGAMACGAVAAVAAQGLGIAVPALWPMVWLALAGYLFGGIAHGTKNVLARTLIHQRAPERLHGRAFAAFNGLRNGAELRGADARRARDQRARRALDAALRRRRAGDRGVCRAGVDATTAGPRRAGAGSAGTRARARRRTGGRAGSRRGVLLVGGALEALDERLDVGVELDRARDLALVVDRPRPRARWRRR